MEPLDFGKFIVQLINQFWDRIIFITECNKGQAVIHKRFGYPKRWISKPGWYWKYPFIDMFDKVDIRKKYTQFNAHSFYYEKEVDESIVPYNLLVDFQAEYQVINPLVIYDAWGFKEGEDAIISYIGNTIHEYISSLIVEKGNEISYNDIASLFDNIKNNHVIENIQENNTIVKGNYKVNIEECISINEIVITSFDKNISLRNTV